MSQRLPNPFASYMNKPASSAPEREAQSFKPDAPSKRINPEEDHRMSYQDFSRADENIVIRRFQNGAKLVMHYTTHTRRIPTSPESFEELHERARDFDAFGRPLDGAGRVMLSSKPGVKSREVGNVTHVGAERRSLLRDCCKGRVKRAKRSYALDATWAEVAHGAMLLGFDAEEELSMDGHVVWDVCPEKLGATAERWLGKHPGKLTRWQDQLAVMLLLVKHERTWSIMGSKVKWRPFIAGHEELKLIFEPMLNGRDVHAIAEALAEQQTDLRQNRKPLLLGASGARCFACRDYASTSVGRNGVKLDACEACAAKWG